MVKLEVNDFLDQGIPKYFDEHYSSHIWKKGNIKEIILQF